MASQVCQVMTNSDREGWTILFHPRTNSGFVSCSLSLASMSGVVLGGVAQVVGSNLIGGKIYKKRNEIEFYFFGFGGQSFYP